MQNIDLICVGKLNAKYFAEGVAEYQKRLAAFASFRIVELPEEKIEEKNASDAVVKKSSFRYTDSFSRFSTVPRRETPAITNCCNMSVLVTLRKYRKIVISHCASFSSITFTISLNYFFLHHITLQEDGFRIPKYFHTQAGNVG